MTKFANIADTSLSNSKIRPNQSSIRDLQTVPVPVWFFKNIELIIIEYEDLVLSMCGVVGRIAGPDKARITEFPHTRFLGDILPPIHVLLVTIGVDAVSPILECCFGFQPKINSTNIPL